MISSRLFAVLRIFQIEKFFRDFVVSCKGSLDFLSSTCRFPIRQFPIKSRVFEYVNETYHMAYLLHRYFF